MTKRLDDPKEYERIRAIYMEPEYVTDLSNDELIEQQAQRRRLSNNQAR